MPLTPITEQPNNPPYLPPLSAVTCSSAIQRKDMQPVQVTAPHVQTNFTISPHDTEGQKAQPPGCPWEHLDASSDFKSQPVHTFCSSCKNYVMTSVSYKVGKLTIMIAGLMCLVGCVAGCCLIPFMMRKTRDVIHTCPNCKMELGRFEKTL